MNSNFFYYYPEGHKAHQVNQHPERPERIETIRQVMIDHSWWQTGEQVGSAEIEEGVLHRIHEPAYLSRLQRACQKGEWFDQDTYLLPASYNLALTTAGGAAQLALEVWNHPHSSGFALCRPPGHHATTDRAMGFCLINNVAVAAEYILHHTIAERVAILDFDLHHGNGTQDIFWERGDIFYLSTHQWPLYPGTGRLDEIGAGQGEFTTANLPMPPGTGDEGFSTSMQELILPLLNRFEPDMLLVSVGFDAHWKDPLGFLQLTAAGYGNIFTDLNSWASENCQGRIALILEGGYNLEAVSVCTSCTLAALLKQPVLDQIGPSPHPDTQRWRNILEQAKFSWQIS